MLYCKKVIYLTAKSFNFQTYDYSYFWLRKIDFENSNFKNFMNVPGAMSIFLKNQANFVSASYKHPNPPDNNLYFDLL